MSQPPSAPATPTTPARQGGAMAWLVLLVLVVGGWQGWQWWQARERARADEAGLQERVAGLEARVDALRRDQRANATRVQQASATNRLLREELLGLGQRASLLEDSVADLADAGAGGIRALRMEEAELLLSTAGQRLVAGDVEGARRTYALAAGVLQRLDGPAALDLRQALAQERAALDAVGPDPAIEARAQLQALADALPELPRRVERAAPRSASWWRRLAARVVDVRPSSGAPIAAPAERAVGEAALQVELTLAHAALERRDAAAFDAALLRIDGWLARLWPATPARERQRATLARLRGRPLAPDAPELGSTLAQLRRLDAR